MDWIRMYIHVGRHLNLNQNGNQYQERLDVVLKTARRALETWAAPLARPQDTDESASTRLQAELKRLTTQGYSLW